MNTSEFIQHESNRVALYHKALERFNKPPKTMKYTSHKFLDDPTAEFLYRISLDGGCDDEAQDIYGTYVGLMVQVPSAEVDCHISEGLADLAPYATQIDSDLRGSDAIILLEDTYGFVRYMAFSEGERDLAYSFMGTIRAEWEAAENETDETA